MDIDTIDEDKAYQVGTLASLFGWKVVTVWEKRPTHTTRGPMLYAVIPHTTHVPYRGVPDNASNAMVATRFGAVVKHVGELDGYAALIPTAGFLRGDHLKVIIQADDYPVFDDKHLESYERMLVSEAVGRNAFEIGTVLRERGVFDVEEDIAHILRHGLADGGIVPIFEGACRADIALMGAPVGKDMVDFVFDRLATEPSGWHCAHDRAGADL